MLDRGESKGRDGNLEVPEPVGRKDHFWVEALGDQDDFRRPKLEGVPCKKRSQLGRTLVVPSSHGVEEPLGVPFGHHRCVGDRLEELKFVPMPLQLEHDGRSVSAQAEEIDPVSARLVRHDLGAHEEELVVAQLGGERVPRRFNRRLEFRSL